jgi:RNA polymerase sigma factor for flagellar operon FliA
LPPDPLPSREQLILDHQLQVRLIATRINEQLPICVQLDDLISVGTLGLISAIDRFDPSRDLKLKTYAEYKIRGAILDSLRGVDWAPRQLSGRYRRVLALADCRESGTRALAGDRQNC